MDLVDIAVIGGGIGGLSTALALQDKGIEAHVFERAPVLAPLGAAIIVRTQSVELLRRWADRPYFDAQAVRVDTMEHHDGTGLLLQTTPLLGEPGDPPWGYSMHRADLFETLRRALPDDRLHLGHEVKHLKQDQDAVTLTFADGSSVRARAVVAADGIRSAVRQEFFSQDTPVFSGMRNGRAVLAADVLGAMPNDRIRMYMGQGHAFAVFPVAGGRQIAYDAVTYSPDPGQESWTTLISTAEIAPAFADFPQVVRDILAAGPTRISSFSSYDRDPIDNWTDGRVALLGDAAHPMLPFKGQGANQAIQDAECLAEHLAPVIREASTTAEINAALLAYQTHSKPRTDRLQAESRHRVTSDDFAPSDGASQPLAAAGDPTP